MNTAERVPSNTPAVPRTTCHHASSRLFAVKLEWITAIGVFSRWVKRRCSCGVKPISGTSTSTCPPRASVVAIRRKYTSVLPLPVTPSSKKQLNPD
nr:hypothetical protein [Thiospirillum jenense]